MEEQCILVKDFVAQMVKNLPEMWETWVQFLGQENPLEKEMATHSGIAWRIPLSEVPGGPGPWSHEESDMTEILTCSQIRKWLNG